MQARVRQSRSPDLTGLERRRSPIPEVAVAAGASGLGGASGRRGADALAGGQPHGVGGGAGLLLALEEAFAPAVGGAHLQRLALALGIAGVSAPAGGVT